MNDFANLTALLGDLAEDGLNVALSMKRYDRVWNVVMYDATSPMPLFDPATGERQLVGRGATLTEALVELDGLCRRPALNCVC